MTNLISLLGSWQGNHAAKHSVSDEGFVVHEFVRGEGSDSVQEKWGSHLKVPDGHAVGASVYLKPVSPVPVTSLVNEAANKLLLHCSESSECAFKHLYNGIKFLGLCFMGLKCFNFICS